MRSSLIITCFNTAHSLIKALDSVASQVHLPDEVVIADDGSTDDTSTVVKGFTRACQIPLLHVWRANAGYRRSGILNRAILESSHEYIITIDGDCVLHRKFVQDHLQLAKKRFFVQGHRANVSMDVASRFQPTGLSYMILLLRKRIVPRRHAIRRPWPTIRSYGEALGSNMAFWRKDIFAVNGFDESFTGWGLEDNEIAIRLTSCGINCCYVQGWAIQYHLGHNSRDKSQYGANYILLRNAKIQGKRRCDQGLDQLSRSTPDWRTDRFVESGL